jgi:hypothetical protein
VSVDFFCAAKAAEGASPRTVEWHRMILMRTVGRFGAARPVDAIPAAELRAWTLELRETLAPESIAGYIRGLKAFGYWCATALGCSTLPVLIRFMIEVGVKRIVAPSSAWHVPPPEKTESSTSALAI